jgi:hypothetical protein
MVPPPHYAFAKYSPGAVDITCYVEQIDCVEIIMPKEKLKTIVELVDYYESFHNSDLQKNELIARIYAEEKIRAEHPTVKAAYEKYKTLLELCRN